MRCEDRPSATSAARLDTGLGIVQIEPQIELPGRQEARPPFHQRMEQLLSGPRSFTGLFAWARDHRIWLWEDADWANHFGETHASLAMADRKIAVPRLRKESNPFRVGNGQEEAREQGIRGRCSDQGTCAATPEPLNHGQLGCHSGFLQGADQHQRRTGATTDHQFCRSVRSRFGASSETMFIDDVQAESGTSVQEMGCHQTAESESSSSSLRPSNPASECQVPVGKVTSKENRCLMAQCMV